LLDGFSFVAQERYSCLGRLIIEV